MDGERKKETLHLQLWLRLIRYRPVRHSCLCIKPIEGVELAEEEVRFIRKHFSKKVIFTIFRERNKHRVTHQLYNEY